MKNPQPKRSERDRKIEALSREIGILGDQKCKLEDALPIVEAFWTVEDNANKKRLYAICSNMLLQIIGQRENEIAATKLKLDAIRSEAPNDGN